MIRLSSLPSVHILSQTRRHITSVFVVFFADNRVVLSLFSLLGREANYTLDPGKLKLVLFIDFVMYIGYLSSCSCVPIYLFQTAQQHDLFKPMRRYTSSFSGRGVAE